LIVLHLSTSLLWGIDSTLNTLRLSAEKIVFNKDTNTTLELTAGYQGESTEDMTDKAQWIITPKGAVQVNGHTLTALKDGNVTVKATVGSVTSNSVKLHITWVVNRHVLPPEPDPTINNSTLLGIDSNNNGVRDDVERWIYEEYKDKHPIYIDIAMQAARGYRLVLEKQPKTKEEAMSIMKQVDSSAYCELYYRFNAKYFHEPLLVHDNIDTRFFRHKIYFNTKQRLDVYIKYDTLFSGDSYTLIPFKERKSACDFNTSKYEE